MSSSSKKYAHFLDCEIKFLLTFNNTQQKQSLHQTTTTTTSNTYEWIKMQLRRRGKRNIELKGEFKKIAGKDEKKFDNSSMQNAMFDDPYFLKYKPSSNKLYISDQSNHIIRSISNILMDNNDNDKWNGKLEIEVGQPQQEGYCNGDRNTCKLKETKGFDWDKDDNMYICSSSCVCKVDVKSNQVSLVAGHADDYGFMDGNNDEARFDWLSGILCYQQPNVDSPLTLYVCDSYNDCIRMIDVKNDKTSTFAGKGKECNDVDGTLESARFECPWDIVKDDENDHILYVSDTYNNKIKMIDMKKGMVTTLVGERKNTSILNWPRQIQTISSFIYVTCRGFNDCIVRIGKHSKQVTKIKFNDGKQVPHGTCGINYHELDQCFYISDWYKIYKLE